MNEDIAIKVEGVSKAFKLPHEKTTSIKSALVNFRKQRTYEKQLALKDISFEVKKGEFFGIVGRNGSGKSTLLKLLAGIYEPNKGTIRVNGKLTPFIELGVGFNPELTGRENVFLNGALLGFSRKEMSAMYGDIVEFAEIEKFMDQKLKNYSSGMQVRLAFSIAIRAKSDILLIDEVLAVGDAAFQQKCYDYFEELKRHKKTVLLVTHDMGAVRRFCSRAMYIHDGHLTKQGKPADIADEYIEENISKVVENTNNGRQAKPSNNSIKAKIVNKENARVKLTIDYKIAKGIKAYIGLAVLKDGISIAEITTPLEKPVHGKGSMAYHLDIGFFNPGAYNIDAALFRLENRELIAVSHEKNFYTIRGSDITKGAALKLEHNWDFEK